MNIICFGDSITRGYDVREGLGWVELCSAALPAYHMEITASMDYRYKV